ncbi:MAG: TerC family protein [Pseudobdellovibrionaceae bacterium]|nr:TerC family protein [Bdellovibrionales bacterium]USN48096.1 MAG: TerC family protein [Pseudobdellovibrionaceae bacterium]
MEIFSVEALTALVTLTAMEIVLGIDNIVFVSIVVARAPKETRERTRKLGIFLALFMRLLLLLSITWVMGLTEPLFSVFSKAFSGRDLILLGGGLFLLAKSTFEIHHKVEGSPEEEIQQLSGLAARMVLLQIILLDIVFSLDSVITAVGMAKEIWVMVVAMVISMVIMLLSAKSIGDFVDRNPAIKILALAFLLLIGVMLVAEGMGQHIEKGYIYFAMAFSLGVELLNMRYRRKRLS